MQLAVLIRCPGEADTLAILERPAREAQAQPACGMRAQPQPVAIAPGPQDPQGPHFFPVGCAPRRSVEVAKTQQVLPIVALSRPISVEAVPCPRPCATAFAVAPQQWHMPRWWSAADPAHADPAKAMPMAAQETGHQLPGAQSFGPETGQLALLAQPSAAGRLLVAATERPGAAGGPPQPRSSHQIVQDIELAHRKKRARRPDFEDDKARTAFIVESEITALVPLLPWPVRSSMLGGPLGMIQVPKPEAQNLLIHRILKRRAGSDGANLGSARLALAVIRKYGALTWPTASDEERDGMLFPMSATLAHELIHEENERALAAAKGKQNGKTVGPRFRDSLIFMSEKLLWPIDVSRAALDGAAPKPKSVGSADKAGTLPIAVKAHLEAIACGLTPLDSLMPLARKAVVFYARTLLAANLDQSIRVGEGVRVELIPDEEDPDHVMRGTAWAGKDGAPLNLYAPAEGILGPYTWYREHLQATLEIGQVYPKWVKPKKSKGSLLLAGELKSAVADKADIREAFKQILTLQPLQYTNEDTAAMSIRGHSMHATFPDWARTIGPQPNFESSLPEPLKRGFGGEDVQALGHWLRDEGAKAEATAEQAARDAEGWDARRAAAIASLRGRPATRGRMANYYGMAGTAANRFSERAVQLRLRQRLAHTVKFLIDQAGGWMTLARGQADIATLTPRG